MNLSLVGCIRSRPGLYALIKTCRGQLPQFSREKIRIGSGQCSEPPPPLPERPKPKLARGAPTADRDYDFTVAPIGRDSVLTTLEVCEGSVDHKTVSTSN
eukprot:sb/3478597/